MHKNDCTNPCGYMIKCKERQRYLPAVSTHGLSAPVNALKVRGRRRHENQYRQILQGAGLLQIADQIKAQIISGAAAAPAPPSERALAQILDVHRNTVVKAYGELKSDAWIESRQGVGLPWASASTGKEPVGESGEGVQMGRVNWVNEVADKYLDMEKDL